VPERAAAGSRPQAGRRARPAAARDRKPEPFGGDAPRAFDELGFPIYEEGACTATRGLYFVGVHFLRKRKSSLLNGVGEDAGIVARQIASR
jgi:hypothetical protein